MEPLEIFAEWNLILFLSFQMAKHRFYRCYLCRRRRCSHCRRHCCWIVVVAAAPAAAAAGGSRGGGQGGLMIGFYYYYYCQRCRRVQIQSLSVPSLPSSWDAPPPEPRQPTYQIRKSLEL